ncbi:MAG: enoyl-CoA hydratase/isomerase family protein [Chloroflexota bacterium]|nr:MAG: enoyl-CoA hydratase/isomerase family protein [Chloroflexota bacterium]
MSTISFETAFVSKADGIATVTLNRPRALNAMSRELLHDLIPAMDDVLSDDTVSAIVLAGAGRAFCAGGDIKEMSSGAQDNLQNPLYNTNEIREWSKLAATMYESPKPIVAVVQGYAVGAGCAMVAVCDVAIAAEDAKFALFFIRRGLVADFGGDYVVPRALRMNKAKEMLYTGKQIDAHEAQRIGLVHRVVPNEQLLQSATELARRMAATSSGKFGSVKHVLHASLRQDLRTNLRAEADASVRAGIQLGLERTR